MYRIVFSRNNGLILLFVLVFAACSSEKERLPYYNTPDFTPVFIQNPNHITDSITHRIGSFSFTDQDGQIISDKTIDGKIHVANFIFTSCGNICPIITQNLKKAGIYFKNDSNVVLLSFSVTPWIDDVATLKAYKQRSGIANKNWHFLTGSRAEIYNLARKSYFAEEDLGFTKDSTQFLHTEHILLIDKTKRIRGIYNGTLKLEIDQLIKDIRALKKE